MTDDMIDFHVKNPDFTRVGFKRRFEQIVVKRRHNGRFVFADAFLELLQLGDAKINASCFSRVEESPKVSHGLRYGFGRHQYPPYTIGSCYDESIRIRSQGVKGIFTDGRLMANNTMMGSINI